MPARYPWGRQSPAARRRFLEARRSVLEQRSALFLKHAGAQAESLVRELDELASAFHELALIQGEDPEGGDTGADSQRLTEDMKAIEQNVQDMLRRLDAALDQAERKNDE